MNIGVTYRGKDEHARTIVDIHHLTDKDKVDNPSAPNPIVYWSSSTGQKGRSDQWLHLHNTTAYACSVDAWNRWAKGAEVVGGEELQFVGAHVSPPVEPVTSAGSTADVKLAGDPAKAAEPDRGGIALGRLLGGGTRGSRSKKAKRSAKRKDVQGSYGGRGSLRSLARNIKRSR